VAPDVFLGNRCVACVERVAYPHSCRRSRKTHGKCNRFRFALSSFFLLNRLLRRPEPWLGREREGKRASPGVIIVSGEGSASSFAVWRDEFFMLTLLKMVLFTLLAYRTLSRIYTTKKLIAHFNNYK
jgi:hypothetical protein